jgi:uncharacterized membrane protein
LSDIKENDFHRALAALLGSNVIAVIQLLTVETVKMDKALSFAVYAFSISIPCLGFIWNIERKIHSKDMPKICMFIGLIGVLTSLVGLGACFDHFSRSASILYGLFTIFLTFTNLMVKDKYAIREQMSETAQRDFR